MENPLPYLSGGMQVIRVVRADGTLLDLDPADAQLRFSEERPNVDRMIDDWGAICEVYKNASESYLTIAGIALRAGDRVTLVYRAQPAITLRVTEVEAGRARVTWENGPGEMHGQNPGMEA